MKNKLLSVILCLAMLLLAVACAPAAKQEESKASETKAEAETTVEESKAEENKASEEKKEDKGDKKELTLGAPGSFFPIIFLENDEVKGFEHDIWMEIGKRCNFEVKWDVSDDYSVLFGNLDAGRIDSIAGQITITEKRKEVYNFSEPYAFQQIKMVVRGDDKAEKLDDLHGRKVCIQHGTVLADFFDDYNAKLSDSEKIETVVTEGSVAEELAVGRFDSYPLTVLLFGMLKEKGQYDFKQIGDPIIVEENGFPFRKDFDQELLKKINEAIQSMFDDGTLKQLSEQWFKVDVTQK